MKARLDFVSNSSSSSFMLVGMAFDNNELEKGWLNLHPGEESKLDEDSEDYDEDIACDIAYSLANELGLETEPGISDYYDTYVLGLPFTKMEDNETKRQFIERVESSLKKAFPDAHAKCIVDGGYEG